MHRSSSLIFLFCTVLAVIDRTNAAEILANTAALADLVPATGDITAAMAIFVKTDAAGGANTKVGVPAAKYLITKTVTAEKNIKVLNCQLVTMTADTPSVVITAPDVCSCIDGAVAGAIPIFSSAPVVAAADIKPLYIFKQFCALQTATNCVSAAASAVGVTPAIVPCVAPPAQSVVVQSSSTPLPSGGGSGATSPNPSSNAPVVGGSVATSPGTPVNSTKAGSSMTTPKIAVMTIVPMALLAVANFVV